MIKYLILFCLFTSLLLSCKNNSSYKGGWTAYPPDDSTTKVTVKTYEGTFSYLADANLFVSCDGKKRLPVAMMSDAYLVLEKEYGSLSKGEGEKIYVRLSGFEGLVDAMEGDGKEIALIVVEVLEIDVNKTCD